jgi:hypothetical protein
MRKLTIARYFFHICLYVDVQKFSELYEVILLAFRNISMSCKYPFKNTELGIWSFEYLENVHFVSFMIPHQAYTLPGKKVPPPTQRAKPFS